MLKGGAMKKYRIGDFELPSSCIKTLKWEDEKIKIVTQEKVRIEISFENPHEGKKNFDTLSKDFHKLRDFV
jgi:hypothetical protein